MAIGHISSSEIRIDSSRRSNSEAVENYFLLVGPRGHLFDVSLEQVNIKNSTTCVTARHQELYYQL